MLARFSDRKKRFENFAHSIKVTTIADKIHNRIQPMTGTGILREYGTVIMTKRHILNFTDSEKVALMYTFLEEHQALATWMSVEAAIAVAGDYVHPSFNGMVDLDARFREAQGGLFFVRNTTQEYL